MNPPGQAHRRSETTDLNLINYPRCDGFVSREITRQNRESSFCFDNSPGMVSAVTEYANDELTHARFFPQHGEGHEGANEIQTMKE